MCVDTINFYLLEHWETNIEILFDKFFNLFVVTILLWKELIAWECQYF